MDYQTFLAEIKQYFSDYFGEQAMISIQHVLKNNTLELDAVSIMEQGHHIAPSIYLNDYYKDFKEGNLTFHQITSEILQIHTTHCPPQTLDANFYSSFHLIKNNIVFKLIHYRSNQELLSQVPHVPYLDLAICFCYYLENFNEQSGSILIRNEHIKSWNISCRDLYEAALQNTPELFPYSLKSMETILQSIWPQSDCDSFYQWNTKEAASMYVLSNQKDFYGASAILYPDLLKKLGRRFRCSFYVIPSSIHEVILVPDKDLNPDCDLSSIIQTVNSEHVPMEDVLSDHAYYYDMNQEILTM
ncbi:MAG: DUF5688 family protein [Lachnospiraceae bacterium]|nr:DUF5688 family protein [Lachnospiraceae bacterium]